MTFRSFRFTSTIHKKIFKNLSKNLPKTTQNSTRKPPKTTIKKTRGKKTHRIDKKSKFGLPTGSLGGVVTRPFSTFFVSGRPWDTLGSQNDPKTSPKSLRDPSGPQFFMIFTQFLMPFLEDFLVLGPIAGTVAGIGPQGNWI